jgi:hypothetical protein
MDAARGVFRSGGSARTDLIALGDVICKNHRSRTEDLESQTFDLGRLDSKAKAHRVANLLRRQADNLDAEAQELQALQRPPADVSRVGRSWRSSVPWPA